MYASILQKYYMDNLPSVMQHKKKKKKKAPNLPLLFSYYSLVLSFPQGESESWHFMTINSIVSVLTGRRVLAHSEVYSDRVLLGSWKT